jgi:indolepyruvate ferredoxin oxidoreductase alpha subunit
MNSPQLIDARQLVRQPTVRSGPDRSMVLSGVAALARGAWEAGVQLVTGYPGTPTTGVFEACGRYPELTCRWAQNEKVALEIAIGSAHAGARTLALMKHVGVNVAADPLFNVAYTGVKGGLVLVVGDDPGAKSSQNEQDTRQLAQAAGVPVFEPANVHEAHHFCRIAFALSERFDLPVIVRVNSHLCFTSERINVSPRQEDGATLSFARPIQKYLLIPAFVGNRHRVRNAHLTALAHDPAAADSCRADLPPNPDGAPFPVGIVASGVIFPRIKEVLGGRFPLLKIGLVHPISPDPVRAFAARCKTVIVAEESSNFLDLQLRSLGISTANKRSFEGVGEFTFNDLLSDDTPELNHALAPYLTIADEQVPSLAVPARLPGFCSGCSHTGVFQVLKDLGVYVVGDIGCNTMGALPPFNALHSNLCMGASIGMLQGYLSVMSPEHARKAVAIIGDSTFFHSGIASLLTLVRQGSAATIVIADNSGSAMTGLQQTNVTLDRAGWLRLLAGLGVPDAHVVDALALQDIKETLSACLERSVLSVCVLLGECTQQKARTMFRYTINEQLCTGCNKCLETNCPSFDLVAGRAVIEDTCVGCGYCAQVCPEQAILPLSVNTLVARSKTASKLASRVRWHHVLRTAVRLPLLGRYLIALKRRLDRKAARRLPSLGPTAAGQTNRGQQ